MVSHEARIDQVLMPFDASTSSDGRRTSPDGPPGEAVFGVSRARAAQLMHTFGADPTGYARTLPRTRLLRQLRTYREGTEFRGEQARREHLMTELRKARLTGIRVTVPVEALDGRLSGLPAGVVVDRIEVRYAGAKEAVVKLVAQAQALNNDYERFEALVAGEGSSA